MNAVQEKTENVISGRILSYNNNSSYFHFHDKFEVLKVISNSCSFLIDGNFITANEGDIVFVEENVFHQFMSKVPTKMKMVQFTAGITGSKNTHFTPVKTHITRQEIKNIPNLEERLDFLIDIILEAGIGILPDENPFVKNIAAAFYHLLAKHFHCENSIEPKDRAKFKEIINYIKQHYTEDISVNQIAENLYISRSHLSHHFKQYAGITINEYINSLRIRYAKSLILEDNSITDVATKSGFNSIRTFNHVYKKYTGMTPSEYISKVKNNITL